MQNFIDDVKGGKIEAFMKSEDIPEDNSGPLTVLVGKNWESIVKDETKDVLVEYYAPWCGHCKKLAPTWEALASLVHDVDDLVIAKFDATANEATGVQIKSYPTLKFYPKHNKRGIDYSGDRDLDAFQAYLAENSSAYQNARTAKDPEPEAQPEATGEQAKQEEL